MPDRILRDELWESNRFLDLPTDAARLAFIRFVSIADDFGNFEGGQRRLFRMLHACTQIKTEQGSAEAIDALMSADLIRRYESGSKEYFHIPRTSNRLRHLTIACPSSPWCDSAIRQALAEKKTVVRRSQVSRTSDARLLGVEVEVGVEVEKSKTLARRANGALSLGDGEVIEKIPVVGGEEFEIRHSYAAELERLFPAVDIPQTLREIRAWNIANKERRKTPRGVAKHITNWMQKVQNG